MSQWRMMRRMKSSNDKFSCTLHLIEDDIREGLEEPKAINGRITLYK